MLQQFLPGTIRVIANITPILVFFVFAQILDVETLGSINYFISLITIVGIFTDFGIPESIQRFLPQVKDKKGIIGHTIKLELLIVLGASTLLLFSDLILKTEISREFLILTTLIVFFSASNTIILIFNGLEDQNSVAKYFGLSSLVFIITTFSLYFFLGFGAIQAFLLGRLISWIIYTLKPISELAHRNLLDISWKQKNYPKFNKFALNTFIYMGSIALLTQWDSLWITHVDGEYANGIYKSIVFIATIPIVLVTIIHTKLLPFLSKLHGQKEDLQIKENLGKYTKYLFLILGTIFVLHFIIYEPILNLLLHEEIVQKASYLFPVAFSAILIHILITPHIAALQAIGEEKIIRNLSLTQVTFFIISTALLYSTYGFLTFPVLLLVSNLVFLIIITIYSRNKFNILLATHERK